MAPSSRNRVFWASKLPSQYSTGLVGASGETHRKCVYCGSPCPSSCLLLPTSPLLCASPAASLHHHRSASAKILDLLAEGACGWNSKDFKTPGSMMW
jgi:hypothetical protein